MATWIHKNGESRLVDYDALKRHIQAGWSTNKRIVKEIEDGEADDGEADVIESDYDGVELSEMTRARLFEIAHSRGIETRVRMSKSELLELLG